MRVLARACFHPCVCYYAYSYMINAQIHNDLLAMKYDQRGKSYRRVEGNVDRSTNKPQVSELLIFKEII